MCEDVPVTDYEVLGVKPHACQPWVEKPEVVICGDEEQARAVV
jgi:hypothetical protein